jgi:hypothetical protein
MKIARFELNEVTMKSPSEFFFMRDGFQTFSLEPERHNFLLFGQRDRDQRNHLLEHLEEASYSLEGHKSVVLGDFGRGKTHQSQNLKYEIEKRQLKLYPIYVKCIEFKSKEPFGTFFKELLLNIPTAELKRIAQAYEERTLAGDVTPLEKVIADEDVAYVFRNGLTAPSLDIVRLSMRWLGGEQKLDMSKVQSPGTVPLPAIQVSKQFGAVMKGLVQLFREIEVSVPVYLIDEAQRFGQVTNSDIYWSWLAALRDLTEIVGVSFIFFIGSQNRDEAPAMFLADELMTRIGVSNYVEFFNQGREDLREFLTELFQTIIRKGPLPDAVKPGLVAKLGEQIDETPPRELTDILSESGESLETYPFTAEAFEQLIQNCVSAEYSNRPREVLKMVQKATNRALRKDSRLVSNSILEEVSREGI